MMPGDDLTALLAPAPAPEVGLRQGVIVAFNQTTAANTVRVGDTNLTDLPILSGAESLEYAPNDVVILLRLKSSWAILGRVIIPGSAARLAPSAVAFDAQSVQATNFALNTFTAGGIVKATLTLTVPAWANRALVFAMAVCVGKQPTTPVPASSYMTTHVLIAGQSDTNKPQGWVDTTDNTVVLTYPSLSRVLTVTGGSTVTVTAEMWASDNWGTNSSNYCRLHAQAIYRREG